MVTPTKEEIEKRKKKLEQFEKGLDEYGKMSEKKLCSQIRSAIRQVWMKHDTKLAKIYKQTKPDMDDSTRTKWLIECECCGKDTKLSDIECDHKLGEHSLKTLEDVLPFAESILRVEYKDLQLVCTDCHSTITYAERYGMSFEDAKKEKGVIAKLKQSVTKQKQELKKAGFKDKDISNADKRREAYRKLLNNQ
jgi:hypothetical protein|tara:strand:- start:15047 stop:15625 length:579 start_codon:yes stop_codon:yes gene_type:complete